MKVLVTWGSKRGSTEGIARIIGDTLRANGIDVDLLPPEAAVKAGGFDAAIVGGALYAGRWHSAARRFVDRRRHDLQRVPVWFFSSGPLDDSSERRDIPPTRQVQVFMERVGALGHQTFGGRLAPDAKGFPASAMAKKHAGDWRNDARIRAWAVEIAGLLPMAHPGPVIDPPGGSMARLVTHGAAGWFACAAIMAVLLRIASVSLAVALHLFAVPLVFFAVARHYFRPRGARGSVTTAWVFVAIVALLDLIIAAAVRERSPVMFANVLARGFHSV